MAALTGNGVRSIKLAEISRRSLLVGSVGGLFVSRTLGQAPAVITSKSRVLSAACTLAPEQTEGPYYVDGALIRSNITEGLAGIPLRLRVNVLDGLRCKAVENAAISIWHCDASGVYSGFTAAGAGRPPMPGDAPPDRGMVGGPFPGPPRPEGFGRRGGEPPHPPLGRGSIDKTRFFRGVQLTDKEGAAEFVTIYPGWYVGRDHTST